MRLAAIIFGAGSGRRMGGEKALLSVEGRPLALLHAQRFVEIGADHVVVAVSPRSARTLRDRAANTSSSDAISIVTVDTAEPKQTILEAERALAASGAVYDAVFVFPVDGGKVRKTTILSLTLALAESSVLAATPRFDGTGGHPVLLRTELLSRLRDAEHLRALLHGLGDARVVIDVDDAAILEDLDTPADFARVFGEPPQFLPET